MAESEEELKSLSVKNTWGLFSERSKEAAVCHETM